MSPEKLRRRRFAGRAMERGRHGIGGWAAPWPAKPFRLTGVSRTPLVDRPVAKGEPMSSTSTGKPALLIDTTPRSAQMMILGPQSAGRFRGSRSSSSCERGRAIRGADRDRS